MQWYPRRRFIGMTQHFRDLSTDPNVITNIYNIINNTTSKYCSAAFIWMKSWSVNCRISSTVSKVRTALYTTIKSSTTREYYQAGQAKRRFTFSMNLFPKQFGLRSLLIFSLKETPRLPYEFTVAGMLERLNAYLEHQVKTHCKFTLLASS